MKRAAAVLSLLVAAASLMLPWRIGESADGVDFFQFWAGAEIATRGGDFYSAGIRESAYQPFVAEAHARDRSDRLLGAARTRSEFEFFSTPLLYASFRLLPRDYDRALLLYRALSLAAFAGGVLLFARASRLSWTASGAVLAFASLLFEAARSEVRVVNVNFVQLFFVGLGTWLACSREAWRSVAGGATFALLTLFKPNVALVLPFLIVLRVAMKDWRRLALEAGGAAGGALLAVLASGTLGGWAQWLARVRGLEEVRPLRLGNVAPALPLVAKIGPVAAYALAAVLAALVVFVIVRAKRDRTPLVVGLALLVYLLSATLVWLHYLVLALPAAIALIKEWRWLAIAGLVFTGLDVFLFLGVRFPQTQALVLWTGLAILFCASLAALYRAGPPLESSPFE